MKLERISTTIVEKLVKANINENDDLFEMVRPTISKEKRAQRFNLLRALTREGIEIDGYHYSIQEVDGGEAWYDIEWFALVIEKLTRADQEDDVEVVAMDMELFGKIFREVRGIERNLCMIEAEEWDNRYHPDIENILRDRYHLQGWEIKRLMKFFE